MYKCPRCNIELLYTDGGNRDTETMGGYDIEYLRCAKCNILYSHISCDPVNDLCEEGSL